MLKTIATFGSNIEAELIRGKFETYGIESYIFHKVLEKMNIPMLILTSDYSPAETGHLRTRIETFIQTIEME